MLEHGGQVRRQAGRTASFDALGLVDDERTCLAGGAAQGAGRWEQLTGRAVAANGVQEVGAQRARGGDEPGAGRRVGAHETPQQAHGESGLAAAWAAAHRDDRAVTATGRRCGLTAAG
ncbi:hypothetical protein AQJ66_36450 [Streptomyces bungoensis]|uniref:Uncharacterized protein n=1 Tax=Streptomyces bungoensis TaxID=285568 RepID=A0A117R7A8_9ACTN|nr:hypothetical protein AQJ66_36450 [Streptomyces bungoensis]